MEIVVEQRLFLSHDFNYRLLGYVLVFPLQLAYCICYYQPPSDYLNIFELAQMIDSNSKPYVFEVSEIVFNIASFLKLL